MQNARIGIDLGGTKIEALVLDEHGQERKRLRISTPREYSATVEAIRDLVIGIESELGISATVGVGMPGTIVRSTGLVKNANSTWLIGKPFERDLSTALSREVRCANDANCLAVRRTLFGAAAGIATVFAVIIGTGCGGGIALHGRVHEGRNAIAGEWGHNGLPWPTPDEVPGPACYCGKHGCMETWVSGTALGNDFTRVTGVAKTGAEVGVMAEGGDPDALAAFSRLEDRLARGLSNVIHILDPDVIVMGGGLSKAKRLYENLPPLIEKYSFGGGVDTPVVEAKHGDSSGVRGAAWLWPL